jgi:hypothetical protein
MPAAEFQQGSQVRQGLFGRVGDMPHEWHFGVPASRLEQNLIVGAVVDVEHQQGAFDPPRSAQTGILRT